MISRTYHSLHLDHTDNGSDKVVYVLLPLQMEEGDLASIEALADECGVNIVLMSDFDWESYMTPWEAPDAVRKNRMYEGKGRAFLEEFIEDYSFYIEHSLRIDKAERYLVGISLSGLFAVWATAQKDYFKGVASISGSFWFEDFVEWISKQETLSCERYYFSLGAKEKDSKNKMFAGVQEATEAVVEYLRSIDKEVIFELNEDSHSANIMRKIGDAVNALIESSIN